MTRLPLAALSLLILVSLVLGGGIGSAGTLDIEGEFRVHIRSSIEALVMCGPLGGPHLPGPCIGAEPFTFEFMVVGADDPNGGNLTYEWDFSFDGNQFIVEDTGIGPVSHTFVEGPLLDPPVDRISSTSGAQAVFSPYVIVANVPPTASLGGPYSGSAGTPVVFSAAASDPSPIDTAAAFFYSWDFDYDGTTFDVDASGSSLTGPSATYTSSGIYAVGVTAKDKDNDTGPVTTATVTVSGPPVAIDQSATTSEDVAVNITLTATDDTPGFLTYAIVTGPTNGVISGAAPDVVYTPNASFAGMDSFTFKANDGTSDSNVATVSITVEGQNDPPVADSQSVSTAEGSPLAVTLTGSDPEGAGITFTVVTGPTDGTLTGSVPSLTYTPDSGFTGSDSFTFKVNDGIQDSVEATVSITVNPINGNPTATAQSVVTYENTPLSVTLSGSDPDSDPITYAVVTGPANGSLSGTAPNLTYTPNTGYAGSDSFTFKVNDGIVDSSVVTVSITVDPTPVLYLHNNPTPPVSNTVSQTSLPLDESAPTATVLINYDTNRDAASGLLITKGGSGVGETDPIKQQSWTSTAFSRDLKLSGDIQVSLWSGIKDFAGGKRGEVNVYVRDFDGASYSLIGTGSLNQANWQAGSGSFVEKNIVIGSVDYLLASGHSIEIKVMVGTDAEDDMFFAYDTVTYDSKMAVVP